MEDLSFSYIIVLKNVKDLVQVEWN